MSNDSDISGIELYGFLGLEKLASFEEVKRSYRKLALKAHPDKNPDDEYAAEKFKKLSKVYEFFSDETKKAEYDGKIKQKLQAEERLKKMDEQTQYHKKMFKEKEREYLEKKKQEEMKAKEVEVRKHMMREEGKRIMKEREEEKERPIKRSRLDENQGYNVKVSWNAIKKKDGYSADEVKNIFLGFGEILDIVKSKTNEGLYLVNFANRESAILSTTATGKPSCPLTVKISFEIGGTQQTPNVHATRNAPQNILDEFLKQNGINPDECRKAAEESESKVEEDEIDEVTGLPIKYVYSHGTDTIFACAAKFSLPPDVRLRGDEEVVHGGHIVRLWPSERNKFVNLVD